MTEFEKELQAISEQAESEPEVKLPTMDEQKQVVAKLKELEAKGELTPEVLETYFGKFYADTDKPVH
ncbi:restriction endonuclease subunit S [Vibrio sp. S4M6]|uniref:restriction endonuclease subunit S n=1 Tax=Vibrio sinus TaxID=2946865 RepID=UPI002029DDB2|nr:restriction endonuclease subunit S [Vibrio sinus]MCL9780602.1 restriction endonuclease subunit S [Vibrio sinus]